MNRNCIETPICVNDTGRTIRIGVWDTFNVAFVRFDIRPWVEAFGAGTLTIVHQRPDEEIPYPAQDVTVEDGIATWTFDAVDTAIEGFGACALIYTVGEERRAKTPPFVTQIVPTLGPQGEEPPEPLERWYDEIIDASAAAVQSAADAAASERNAAESERNAAASEREAAASAGDAAASALGAAESAADAQTALEGMVYVTFTIDTDGHVILQNGDLTGTTTFELLPVTAAARAGHLEVNY